MGWFQEERAGSILHVLGVDGCPGRERLGVLVDLVGDLLSIQETRGEARIRTLPDGRALLYLPPRLTCQEIDEQSFHEVAHFLHRHGVAAWLRQTGHFEEAASIEASDEREVEDFLLAFLLPAHVVYMVRKDSELAEQSGCSVEIVRLRKERLERRSVQFKPPAAWSAWHHFDLIGWNAPERPAIQIREQTGLLFEVPTSWDDTDELMWRLNAELVIFTYDEFRAKYQHHAVPPTTSAKVPVGEIGELRLELDAERAQRIARGIR